MVFGLSIKQERRLLFEAVAMERCAPTVPFVIPSIYRLFGTPDPIVISRAAQAVVDRHDALRSRFHLIGSDRRRSQSMQLFTSTGVHVPNIYGQSTDEVAKVLLIEESIADGDDEEQKWILAHERSPATAA